jgi:hypothetical protein
MDILGDVAINGRASGSSWSLRAYPPWTRRRDAFGSRYASPLLNIQYVASAKCRATAPIAFAWPLRRATRSWSRLTWRDGPPAREANRIRRFDECPLQVAIDVRARWPESGLAAAGVNARGRPRIAGQLLGCGKPRFSPAGDRYRARQHPAQRAEPRAAASRNGNETDRGDVVAEVVVGAAKFDP